MWYRTLSRDTLQNGVSHRCACVSTKEGVSHRFGGVLTSLEKVSRDMGYRSDSIALSRDMGPLRRCNGTLSFQGFVAQLLHLFP